MLLDLNGKSQSKIRSPQLDANGVVIREVQDPKTFYLAYDFVEKHYYAISFLTRFLFQRLEDKYKYCFWCYRRHQPQNFDRHNCSGLHIPHYQCEICKNLFFDKQHYDSHVALESKGWDCDCCGKTTFRGNDCFENHGAVNCKPPIGERKVRCIDCGFPCLEDSGHVCKEYYECKFCNVKFKSYMVLQFHTCFFNNQKQKRKAVDEFVRKNKCPKSQHNGGRYFTPHWFYDFETCREDQHRDQGINRYKHKVMAWCMKLICLPSNKDSKWEEEYEKMLECIQTKLDACDLEIDYERQPSDCEGKECFVIVGKSLESFMTLVFRHLNTKEIHPTLWAHNGSKFDGKFILNHILNVWNYDLAGDCYSYEQRLAPTLLKQKGSTEPFYEWKKSQNIFKTGNVCQVAMIGSKALSIRASDVTFRCSYAHLTAPLSKLPKMFGFKDTAKKGEFPYGRLSETAWGSVHEDGLPPLEEYSPNTKRPEERRKLILWWFQEQVRRNASTTSVMDQVKLFDRDFDLVYEKDPTKPTEPWVFNNELWAYLLMDVEVGARALYNYHTSALEMQDTISGEGSGLSPLHYSTSPAWAKDMWQLYFMPKDEVAVLKRQDAAFIRSALHGGRTDKRGTIITLTDEAFERGDRIHYYDFKSLYPSVQKCSVHDTYYPGGMGDADLGGPLVNHRNMNNRVLMEYMEKYTGYLEIDSTHLKYVTHPTLCRMKSVTGSDKLMFTNEDTIRERYAWPEIEEAIRSGEINVTKVHRAILFDRTKDIFNDYVDFFFKVKEDAERDGNEGRRSLGKLLLNSLWGKLGQNAYPIREWVQTVERERYLQEQFEKGYFEFISCIPKGERLNHYCYRVKHDFNNLGTTAVHLAAHVSTWGRVMLHKKVLSVHGQRAVYCDTDSAIIYLRKEDTMPYVGKGLGDLTNEVSKILKDAGKQFTGEAYIREAVLVAPKTYALHLQTSCGVNYYKVVCKGFEPSYQNSKAFHFENFKKLVQDKTRVRTSSQEEPLMKFISGAPSLRFESSLTRNEITPVETYSVKKLTGEYDKGIIHPLDERLIIPYGTFQPESSFLLDQHPTKHYE